MKMSSTVPLLFTRMTWRKFRTLLSLLQRLHLGSVCVVLLGIFLGYVLGFVLTVLYQYSNHLFIYRVIVPIDHQYRDSKVELASDREYEKKLLFSFPSETRNEGRNISLKKQKEFYSKQHGLQQQLIRDNSGNLLWLKHHLVPQFECPMKARVGMLFESAYFMCNPWVLAKLNDCVVYSFGVQGVILFEERLFELSKGKCRFFCFDMDPEDDSFFVTFNGTFRQATISGRTDSRTNELAILDVTKMYGHRKIDVLKMDIEGAEFISLPPFFRNYDGKVCHLLIEFHGNYNADALVWIQLLRMLEKRGFRMFEKEVNAMAPRCVNFSFLHLSCFHDYGISLDAVLFMYFDDAQ